MNPYYGNHFWQFFLTLAQRLFSLPFRGFSPLAPDEVQLIVLLCVGCSCSILGCLLLYRKESMLANSLSHTALLGIAVSYLLLDVSSFKLSLYTLFLSALLTGFLTQTLMVFLQKKLRVQLEASNALTFHFLFSLGLVLLNLYFKNSHVGLELLVGNVDTLTQQDIPISLCILVLSLCSWTLFFNYWKVFAFDEGYAKILGLRVGLLRVGFIFLLSLNVIGAIRGVGVLMMLCLTTAPCIMAHSLSFRLKHVMLLAPFFSMCAVLIGLALSRHLLSCYNLALSTGAIVGTLLFFLTLCTLFICQQRTLKGETLGKNPFKSVE